MKESSAPPKLPQLSSVLKRMRIQLLGNKTSYTNTDRPAQPVTNKRRQCSTKIATAVVSVEPDA